jgi:iron complex transport system permease protein
MKKNILLILFFLASLLAISISCIAGAVHLSFAEMFNSITKTLFSGSELNLHENIFMNIRFPRAILSFVVGASLAIGGVLMQGLFRNPLIEPGLIGTSSGAALGSSFYFLSSNLLAAVFPYWTLPICAFIGSLIATLSTTGINSSNEKSKSSSTQLLLTGIAVNAICMSLVGILSFFARDPQARSITFWGLGSLASANWKIVSICTFTLILGYFLAIKNAKSIDALQLGEKEAHLLGIKIKNLRISIILTNVILVGIATSFVGVISFLGLIIPHILRGLGILQTKQLLIAAALLGGSVLCLSDVVSRLVIAPTEIPIGIITALIGAPIFIYLIRTKNEFLA